VLQALLFERFFARVRGESGRDKLNPCRSARRVGCCSLVRQFLDAGNRCYDDAAQQVVEGFLVGKDHPSTRDPKETGCVVNQDAGSANSALHGGSVHADTVIREDYDELRCKTGRHSACSSYCMRRDSVTKKDYCRFAKGLEVRGGDYGFRGGPGDEGAKVDQALQVARSHFYCEPASANDGTVLLRTQFYVSKTDPHMNSCCPTHARVHRSNVDCKACIDKYGVCQYVTKFANYCSKPEKQSAHFGNLLATKLQETQPGAAAHAPCRAFLFDICNRDYSAQEVSAINLKCKSAACSHSFVHCR